MWRLLQFFMLTQICGLCYNMFTGLYNLYSEKSHGGMNKITTILNVKDGWFYADFDGWFFKVRFTS